MDAVLGMMLCEGTDALLGDGGFVRGWMLCCGLDAELGMDALPDHAGMQLKSGSALARLWECMQSRHAGMLSCLQTPRLHPMCRLEKPP